MPAPSEIPNWATTTANRAKPTSGAISSGFALGTRPPARWVNWLLGMTGDWLGWLNSATNRLVPKYYLIDTVGTTTWTRPAGLVWCEGILIAGGRAGLNGGASTGGDGGYAGMVVPFLLHFNTLLTNPSITIGAGGVGGGSGTQHGGHSYITDTGSTIVFAEGGSEPVAPADVATRNGDAAWFAANRVKGGTGGSAAAGARGWHSGYGIGGAGGATNAPGQHGWGYGAGGGGGRQSSGSASGGGGGGGGYGTVFAGATSGSGSTGGNGSKGACIITAWCDLSGL